MATKTDHTGHRERLRERIRQNGLESLQPHEVLEFLLFPFVPRRNTNDIAHRLLDTFGSLANVLDAPSDALAEVSGMTQNAALFLSTLPALNTVYADQKLERNALLESPAQAAKYLCGRIGNLPYENFAALCLDAKGCLQGVVQIRSQSADSVFVNVRELMRRLVATRAVNVIVAHNHPSGSVDPSEEDIALYKHLKEVLDTVGIRLVDCLVVSGTRYFSFNTDDEFRQNVPTYVAAETARSNKQRAAFAPSWEDDDPDLLFPIDIYDPN